VSGERQAVRAERKALLSTRAELDRARVALAVHQIKVVIAPVPEADRVTRLRPAAAILAGLAGSFAGAPRLARWLRVASLALAALRIVRAWK